MSLVTTSCPTGLVIPYGNVKINEDGRSVTYKCADKFQLVGSASAECKQDGTWSSPPPTCIGMSIIILEQMCSNDILYLYPLGETSIIFYVELRLFLGTNYPCKTKDFSSKGLCVQPYNFGMHYVTFFTPRHRCTYKKVHTSRTLAARQGNRTFKIYRIAQNFYMELNFMILWLLAET